MKYLPFDKMKIRLNASKNESDTAYFFDLLLLGEFLTKTISLFLVSSINDDKERTRYRFEHTLVRANAIGDFSRVIDEIVTGPAAQILTSDIRDYEIKELTQRVSGDIWQYQSQVYLNECLDIFEVEYNSMGNKSPLRNWFSNFTLLRNKTKGHGAPKAENCSLAAKKLELSIDLILLNFTAFKRNWAYLHRNLSGKYRVSEITNDISNFSSLTRENELNYTDGIYVFIDKPRLLNLFYSNSELSDFWISNGNLKKDKFETISYITDNRILQNAKDYFQPIEKLPSSHTEGANKLNIIGNSFSNLPTPPDLYVTRNELETELFKVISQEDRFPIITLLGKGGVGKTSLALNYLEKVAKETKRFDVIIWFSSRDIDLLIDGPKQVETKVLNIKDIAEDYFSLIYPTSKENSKEKIEIFAKELTHNPLGKTLYVFDNFETVTNPIEVFEWLNTYIRNPNKILITSRISRNFKADYPIEIQGMSDLECRELIHNTSDKLKITNLLNESYINELISESDGHPYIIKIILGEVAKSKKLNKIKRIIGEQDNILSALFTRTFHTLSPVAKRVFLTLCSWNSMIPRIAVEAVLWRPENDKMDVSSAIEELRTSSFIDIIENEETEIINLPLAAIIFGRLELEVYPEKLKILADKKLLMEFGTTSNSTISSGLIRNIELKFKAIIKRTKNQIEFEKELPVLEFIANKYPKTYEYIIDVYEDYRNYNKIKYYLREYLKRNQLINERIKLWEKLSNICKITKDWQGESQALVELSQIPNIDYSIISDAANRINNNIYFDNYAKQDDYKNELLLTIINLMKSRLNEASATDLSRLGWLLLNNNQVEQAIEMINKGLELEPDNSYCLKLKIKLDDRV